MPRVNPLHGEEEWSGGENNGLRRAVEAMCEPAAIDVEGFEDFVDRIGRNVIGDCPVENVQIFFAGGELIQNQIEQFPLCLELLLEKTEVATVQFDPETLALKMLNPPRSQITPPVFFHPLPNG